MKLTAIDAFAGAGGISLGLKRSGWDIVFAFDHDPVAVETYRRNLGDEIRILDAEVSTPREILETAGLTQGSCDLLVGGPPCQGFSLQRRGESVDPRSQLVLRFVDLIVELRPRGFLMENVPAIATKRGRELLDALLSRTADAGYRLYEQTLDAIDYGVAQHRRRTFIVGLEAAAAPFRWPQPRPLSSRLAVRDALAGLPPPPADGSPHPDIANHYREARLSALNIERIKHVPQGGGRESLPPELQLQCHLNGHRHLDTYGRLAWDAPAGTITARFDSFTRGRFAHPEEHRSITLREGARLQGFPDDFEFLGSREDGARMIGNAVPPPVAEALGRALSEALRPSSATAESTTSGEEGRGPLAQPTTVQVPLGL